jgi:hypothetical protein
MPTFACLPIRGTEELPGCVRGVAVAGRETLAERNVILTRNEEESAFSGNVMEKQILDRNSSGWE